MDKIRVLMIDDNVNLVDMVKEYFINNSKISEDLLFVLQTILKANQISFINDVLYFYRFNKN